MMNDNFERWRWHELGLRTFTMTGCVNGVLNRDCLRNISHEALKSRVQVSCSYRLDWLHQCMLFALTKTFILGP